MPDEGTGDSGTQVAAGNDGAIIDADGTKLVPLTALEGARAEAKAAKEAAQMLQDQNDLYKANMAKGAESQTTQSVFDPFADLNEADVVTVADVKKIMSTQEQRWGEVANQLRVGQGAPDYLQTIEKYLPGELAKDPELAAAIQSSQNPALLALKIAKGSKAYIKDQQEALLKGEASAAVGSQDASLILANQGKPGATSTGSGAGGGVGSAEFYQSMSDDDLETRIENMRQKA